ncbi:MAG: acyltransferase family protein [Hyphomonadaceae bacterium]
MPGKSALQRRYDLDWLRVGALGLLILTHVLYVYRTVPWRVHSANAGMWGDLFLEALAPWRISLVFFIAGAATRFMLERKDLPGFVQNRILRLGVPFVMALILFVPTMSYLTDPHAGGHNYIEYVFDHAFHNHNLFGFWVPDLGHVWFLPYLLTYSVATGIVWSLAPNAFQSACDRVARQPVLVIGSGLAAMFILSDAFLKPVFGRTDMFLDDPAGHVRCIPPFLLGVMLVRADGFWTRLKDSTHWLYPAALGLGVLSVSLTAAKLVAGPALPLVVKDFVSGLFGATAVFAVLAFGAARLQSESPIQRYFGDAIMPIYLMHQPLIVAGYLWAAKVGLPGWLEFPLVLAAASLIPLAVYHFAIRKAWPLRILFGLKAELPGHKKSSHTPGVAAHTGRS